MIYSMVGTNADDDISAFRCGKNVKYQMCEDYEGDKVTTTEEEDAYRCDVYRSNSGAGRAGGDRMKPNDKMSAITLQHYD